jgi:hypothetical protein
LVLVSGFGWWVLSRQGSSLATFMIFFLIIFLFVAAGTSLSNWMERKSRLELRESGLRFSNGLRNIQLGWDEIQQVHVLPSRWGKAVHVLGLSQHFHFQLAGEVMFMGRVRDKVGFLEGEEILTTILEKTGLKLAKTERPGRYFVRG